ncbi:aldehyde dehydrogenase family protein [Psychrobacillus sp. FSL H8-0484]
MIRTLTSTILTNVKQDMTIVFKEVFAPIFSIMPYNN